MLYAYSFSRFAFSPFVFYSVFKVHLVGSSGLEPPTSRLSGARSSLLSYEPLSVIFSYLRLSHYQNGPGPRYRCRPLALPVAVVRPCFGSYDGGDEEIRTLDPLLAGQVLSQLSYTPGFL